MIKVEITQEEIVDISNPVIIEMYCISKLKKAGIPIIGTLAFHGLRTGVLTKIENPAKKSYEFIYQKHRKLKH